MYDTMCEKCKYKDVSTFSHPCMTCKYSFMLGTVQFDNGKSFFEPANAEDAERGKIDHPAHYAGKIECIDALLETMGRDDVRAFCLCNAFKYLWRCKKKHETPEEDVEKAVWYLQKYLELGGKA